MDQIRKRTHPQGDKLLLPNRGTVDFDRKSYHSNDSYRLAGLLN